MCLGQFNLEKNQKNAPWNSSRDGFFANLRDDDIFLLMQQNNIFWSKIGPGFGEQGGTSPPRTPRDTPRGLSLRRRESCCLIAISETLKFVDYISELIFFSTVCDMWWNTVSIFIYCFFIIFSFALCRSARSSTVEQSLDEESHPLTEEDINKLSIIYDFYIFWARTICHLSSLNRLFVLQCALSRCILLVVW